ncbi:sigma-70 family RNA polymerase sigma factor [Chitinophaga sp. CC14]|uniref:RNA polymerase sigma factor n=1 Tax=Chitinophaga sp. CC14 TaxID=3029199 RepID=UPI003B79229B
MSGTNTHIKEELLSRIAEGDGKAFTQLLEEYSGLLYSFVVRHTGNRELAEEIVQDIFTQIWQTRESLAEIRNFRTYLYVISRNRIVNEIKKAARERKKHKEWMESVYAAPEEDRSATEQQYSLIDAAINRLPPQQLKVWTLNRREGFTYQQIAASMNISRETVKTYLQHANTSITKYIAGHLEI